MKPFEIVELIARVQVVLRRFHKDATKLVYGDLVINTDNRTVLRDCVPVELTPKEFMLLEIFVRNRNITLFRDKIYELVWEMTATVIRVPWICMYSVSVRNLA